MRRRALLLLWPSGLVRAAPPLRVVFGVSRPPFVDEREHSGIALELFAEAARRLGWRYESQHAPNKRMLSLLRQGAVDVAVEVPRDDPTLHFSRAFLSYRNVLLLPPEGPLHAVRNWHELAGLRVCAWQLAEQALGPGFVAARPLFAQYEELADQRNQVRLWLRGRCEVLVIDRDLLLWHLRELARSEPQIPQPPQGGLRTVPVPGMGPLDWYVGFRDAALRDRFDTALAALRADGSYQRIVNRHLLGSP